MHGSQLPIDLPVRSILFTCLTRLGKMMFVVESGGVNNDAHAGRELYFRTCLLSLNWVCSGGKRGRLFPTDKGIDRLLFNAVKVWLTTGWWVNVFHGPRASSSLGRQWYQGSC